MIIKHMKTSLFTLLFAFVMNVAGQQAIAFEQAPSECGETVFPVQSFVRTKGAKNIFIQSFSLPLGVTDPYTIHIQDINLRSPIGDLTVWINLNGNEIVRPKNLKKENGELSLTIDLEKENKLEVILVGKPGSGVFVDICGAKTGLGDVITPQPPIVEMPPDANIPPESIIIQRSDIAVPKNLGDHFFPVSNIYDISLDTPDPDAVFSTPAAIHFSYDKEALMAAGFVENFTVWFFDEDTQTWKPVDGGITVDTVNAQVTAFTSHFTPFVLGASPDFLWAAYTTGSEIHMRETTRVNSAAIFQDNFSIPLHTLHQGASVASSPSLTTHKESQWMAWRENNTIYVKAVWWGPGITRKVYEGGVLVPLTAPAIESFNDRLVVVWGEANQIFLSHSEFGVEWSPPLAKPFAGTTVNNPAIEVHQGTLFVGAVFGAGIMTISIHNDFTWGPNFQAFPQMNPPPRPEVTLATDGDNLWMGIAANQQIFVAHSPTGHNNWSPLIQIDGDLPFTAAPALEVYNGFLYAVYPLSGEILLQRSPDGLDWTEPPSVLEPFAPGLNGTVELIPSAYTVNPPTPIVTVVNDSGLPAAQTLNFVIISDGYLQSEMPDFEETAQEAFDTFRIINPFSRHLDTFNMYRIDIPSRQKGADASPIMAAAIRLGILRAGVYQSPIPDFEARYTDTSLGSHYRDCWGLTHVNNNIEETQSSPNNAITPNCDAAEDFINPHPGLTGQKQLHIFGFYAYDLVQQLIPGFDHTRDLLYVIYNHIEEDGGTDKASYNPIVLAHDFADGFVSIHEMGHFMTSLSDEEKDGCWGGMATDCNASPNKTINNDLTDPNHKWAHFFVNEGRPGDSIIGDPLTHPPVQINFWDTTVVNGSSIFNVGLFPTQGSMDWSGTLGNIVFGPALQCIMNHTGGNSRFCPVCTEEFVKELFSRAAKPFVHGDYHNNYNQVFVEYEHNLDSNTLFPTRPKTNFIKMNGTFVDESEFFCRFVGGFEICSVNVTNHTVNGLNSLTFAEQPGFPRNFNLLSLQIVNSNGAPLPIFPLTDLSNIGSEYYFSNYHYQMDQGDLEFEFNANLTP